MLLPYYITLSVPESFMTFSVSSNVVTVCDITPLLLSKSKIKKKRGEKVINKIKEKERN